MNKRLVFLIIESEQQVGLSTRKLLIETAKHNVLTAYSGREGLEIFTDHLVDAVVIDAAIDDMRCEDVAGAIKHSDPKVPVIVLTPDGGLPQYVCKSADEVVNSYDPAALLKLLEKISARPPRPQPERATNIRRFSAQARRKLE